MTSLPDAEQRQVACYLVDCFDDSTALQAFMLAHVWPAMKVKTAAAQEKERQAAREKKFAAREARIAEWRAKRDKQDAAAAAAKREANLSSEFTTVDGAPLTVQEVARAADKGVHLRSVRTGKIVRFHHGRSMGLPAKYSCWKAVENS